MAIPRLDLTRKAYEASILAICDETGLARTAAGLAGTATVALYGGGQFVTGLMADRFNPCRIVLAALLLTAACNLALPFAVGSVAALVALQAVNGFAQAMFWPPLVKILANSLSKERYNGAVFVVNVAANIAIIAIFALVAGCVRFAGWRLSFWIVAGMALARAVAWGQLCSGGFWSRVLESANPESRNPQAKPETRNYKSSRMLAAAGRLRPRALHQLDVPNPQRRHWQPYAGASRGLH